MNYAFPHERQSNIAVALFCVMTRVEMLNFVPSFLKTSFCGKMSLVQSYFIQDQFVYRKISVTLPENGPEAQWDEWVSLWHPPYMVEGPLITCLSHRRRHFSLICILYMCHQEQDNCELWPSLPLPSSPCSAVWNHWGGVSQFHCPKCIHSPLKSVKSPWNLWRHALGDDPEAKDSALLFLMEAGFSSILDVCWFLSFQCLVYFLTSTCFSTLALSWAPGHLPVLLFYWRFYLIGWHRWGMPCWTFKSWSSRWVLKPLLCLMSITLNVCLIYLFG